MRLTYDALCNKGVSCDEMFNKFPDVDFSQCQETWDYGYPPHSFEDTVLGRAESVRLRLKVVETGVYRSIYLVRIPLRECISFLVQGERFHVCGKYKSNKNTCN